MYRWPPTHDKLRGGTGYDIPLHNPHMTFALDAGLGTKSVAAA